MPEKTESKKLCFVIGPIGDEKGAERIHADWLLHGIIEPVIADFPDFAVKRADHDPRPGLIDAQMITDILNAELVIADLSLFNPNAFYEIGIRHMAQKPIIHMQLANEKAPFDVSLYRAIKFSRETFRDLGVAKDELKKAINAVLAKDYQVENPVTNARGRLQLQQHATPEIQVLMGQMESMQSKLNFLDTYVRSIASELALKNAERVALANALFSGTTSQIANTPALSFGVATPFVLPSPPLPLNTIATAPSASNARPPTDKK